MRFGRFDVFMFVRLKIRKRHISYKFCPILHFKKFVKVSNLQQREPVLLIETIEGIS